MNAHEVFEDLAAKINCQITTHGTAFVAKCPVKKNHKLIATILDDKLNLHSTSKCTLEELLQALELKHLSCIEGRHLKLESRSEEVAKQYLRNTGMPSFDPTNLPELLRNYVHDVTQLTGSDSILTTISALSTLSAYAMHKIQMQGYFQDLHPCIWSLTLSASGAFKSTGLRLGTQVLRDLDKGVLQQLQEARAHEDEDREKQLAKLVRGLPDSFSWQGLLDRLQEQGGGLMMQSEFSSFLHNLNAKWNEGVKARITSVYDVVEPIEERTRGSSTIRIELPYLSICGVSTIDFVRDLITSEDLRSGFLPRFLLFSPPSTSDTIPAALPSVATSCNIREWSSYQSLKDICEGLLITPARVGFTQRMEEEARQCYSQRHDEIYQWVFAQEPSLQGSLYSFAKRWGPCLLKLSMLMQLVIDREQVEPGVEAIEAANEILLYAMGSTRLLIAEELGQSPMIAKESKILAYIAKRGGSLNYRQLLQSRALAGGVKEYDYILETLESKGKLRITGDSKNSKTLELA